MAIVGLRLVGHVGLGLTAALVLKKRDIPLNKSE